MPERTALGSGSVRFNGAATACPPGLTLAALLVQQGVDPAAVATAINGAFIARDQRSQTTLHSGDDILTFQAIVGG